MTNEVETFTASGDSGVEDWLTTATNRRIDQPVRLLSVEELANFLQVPVQTIYGWRKKGEGPRGLRVGRHLRFVYTDVLMWLDRRAS